MKVSVIATRSDGWYNNRVKKIIVLTGIKHCGKSTQGLRLAERFGCPFFDTDTEVVAITGLSPRELYTTRGEAAFISAESAACRRIAEQYADRLDCGEKQKPAGTDCCRHSIPYAVVATGGGICGNQPAVDFLKDTGFFVYLNIPETVAADRIIRAVTFRSAEPVDGVPAYIARENPRSEADIRRIFSRFYRERSLLYRQLADIVYDVTPAPVEQNTARLLALLEQCGFKK